MVQLYLLLQGYICFWLLLPIVEAHLFSSIEKSHEAYMLCFSIIFQFLLWKFCICWLISGSPYGLKLESSLLTHTLSLCLAVSLISVNEIAVVLV